jgi:hypothetical protein
LRFPEPTVTPLDVRRAGRTHYVVREGMRMLAYQRNGERLHFFLDQAVQEDLARRWLPEVEAYVAGMVDHLLRAKLQIVVAENKAEVTLTGTATPVEPGATLHVYSEDEAGVRTELASQSMGGDTSASFVVPKGTRKVAAHVRGRDGAGAFVVAAEARIP